MWKFWILVCVGLPAFQQTVLQAQMLRCERGVVVFRSEAPLEVIRAESYQLRGVIDTLSREFAWRVRMRSFEGFNNPLQREHFNEDYMESEKYPEATFIGYIIEPVEWYKNGAREVRAKGKFAVHGVEQERIIRAVLDIKGKCVSIKSAFLVLLADHRIAIPRAVFQKIAEAIQVTVEAELIYSK